MIRRARLSFKPNVRPSGRVAGQGSASSGQNGGVVPPAEPVPDPGKEAKTAGPGESTAPVTGDAVEPQPQEESKAELTIETPATVSNETPPSKTASATLQRRKRISTLPNLAKPRVSNSASAAVPPPKPSQVDIPSTLPVSTAPCKNEGSPPEKGKVLSPQKSQLPLSPPQGQHVTLPEKRTPVPQVPQFSPYKKSVLKPQEVSSAKPVECTQKEEPSPLKERPSQKSCSNELFEVLKKTTQKKVITSNLEKERLRRAQKLRDLLKAELRKERKAWKAKHPVINTMVEPEKSTMTMRDFIHFIPINNPMSSSLEESKSSEKSPPVESPVIGTGGKNSAEEDDLDDEDVDNEEDDSQLLAPRVKVAEDGSIILDEESLTVEVSRSKGAPIVEGNDPIFERGSTTTYSSFRRNTYSKPWSEQETDMFFLAISMVGTDFSMIGQLFPHRERIEIKNKFKKEERVNGWRIDKAFREKKDFDFEFFTQLLEKALEAGKKKKTRSKQPRKTSTKSRKKTKEKTAAEQSLCNEESVVSEEEGADARTAEKENKRSLDVDECSGVADPVPVKKKRAKRKKDATKEPEEENHESQDDDLTPKKKFSKSKTAPLDTDNRPELQSVDSDGSLKETQAEKKTRVQKNKPNYKELEDDENDADFDITEDLEVDDAPVSCKAREADLSSQSVALTCEEENSLVLFTEESDYHSGPEDISSMHHSLNEVNEAVSQASDVSLVVPNLFGETEPMNITQEETSPSDKPDHSDKGLDAESGQLDEPDSEPKDKRKMRQARPAPNLSRASIKKKVSTEEQSDTKHQADPSEDVDVGKSDKKIVQKEGLSVDQQGQDVATTAENASKPHNGQKESSIKPSSLGRGRLQRPKPNLLARSSTRKEKLDVTDAKDISIEGNDKSADISDVLAQNEKDDTGNLNKGVDVSSIDDNHRQDSSSTVQVSSPSQKDVASESDLSRTEESNTVQQDCDKGDASKKKPSLPVRGRLRPKPNLTRAPAKSKSSDTEQESQHSQVSGQVSHGAIKPQSHTPGKEQENEVKDRVESSSGSQDECRKSSIKPAPLARGGLQRPKPNLVKASSRKEAFDDNEESTAHRAGHTEEDSGRDFQNDGSSGKQESYMLVNTGSISPQDSCKSELNLHPSSSVQLIQDSTVNQDHLTESPSISKTQSIKSPSKPAPLTRGWLQKPKPNLLRASGQKGGCEMKESKSFEAVTDTSEKKSPSDDNPSASCVENPTELVKEVTSIEQHTQDSSCLEKKDSVLPMKVDSKNLMEEPNTPLKPTVLPKGRFQSPKPNLGREAARRDGLDESKNLPEGEACVEREVKSKDTTSNIPVNEAETSPLLAKTNEEISVAEKDSATLEKPNNGASHETSVDSTPATTGKAQTASDDERKTLKPVLTRGRFQRPKPNLNKSTTRSVGAAPLVSTAEEEEKRTGTKSTHKTGPNSSLDGEVSDGDVEIKSSTEKDSCDKTAAQTLAQPAEVISDAEQGEAASLKPVRSRFPKPSPNLGRAAVRKETLTTQPKTLVPEKGEETLKVNNENPELKIEELTDTSIAGQGCKEAVHTIEEKSAAIKPAQLRRGRLIRPVPNLVKPSKTLSPLQSKTNEDLNGAPALKDKNHVVATSSPTNKRKASNCNVEVFPKRICPSDAPQKASCLSDSEMEQVSLTNDAQSSSQSGDVEDAATPQRSRFGRPLRKLSTPPSVSPKSENSSDRPEKEKAARNVKSNITKVSKPVSSKSKGKTTLVKIRATRQEEDEDEDADLGFEDENYDLAPDMQNQAPVFIPFSLRSPRPVTAEIEETVEELEIPVDGVDLPNSTNQDLQRTPFQHVLDPQAQSDKKEQYDGSAEAAMTLISMGSSVYKPNTGEFSSTRIQNNQEQFSSLKQLSSPSRDLLSSPDHVPCAMESSVNVVDPSMVADPHSAPTDFGSTENLPNPINDSIVFPIEQLNYPVMPGDALQGDFSSQDVSVSDCLLREHDTGEETTFILTLVEIPINDDYAYSCDSSMAECLPAPVLISSGSSQALTQNLNPSVETVTYEPHVAGQDDKDLILGQTPRKRSAECIDEEDHSPLQKKPLISEQVVDLEIKATADEADGDEKVAPEVSVTEPKHEEPAGVSQISATAVSERPPYWPIEKISGTVPVEMPGMSVTNSLNRNLPLVYANSVTTSKTTLKRPGKKPLGFLSLICKEKQSKKSNEEDRKKKNLPKPKCRKVSSTAHGQQKESLDVNLENTNDSEVPSSSSMFSPAELQSSTTEEAVPSESQISDNQGTEEQTPSKSHELVTEEEAAPVSEFFLSDIFMEVDD